MDIAKVFNDKAHKFLLCFRSRMIGEMQAFPEIEILEGEGYRQTQYWLNIYIGDAQRSV